MNKLTSDPSTPSLLAAARVICVGALLVCTAVHAEKADRGKPLNVEADNGRYDDVKQTGVFTGNVVVTKGSMSMRAANIEVRQAPDGAQFGIAIAEPGKRAIFRQKREGLDEYIEGEGERIEYDGAADVVRFINRAVIRRYRGAVLADETAGSLIVYDNVAEVFNVVGGVNAQTPTNPSGRVRAVLTPRDATAAPAASQPGVTLKPSPNTGDKR